MCKTDKAFYGAQVNFIVSHHEAQRATSTFMLSKGRIDL